MIDDIWIQISGHPDIVSVSGTGYHTIKCPVCGDSKVRAGFSNDGERIIYNCFRGSCDANTVWEYAEGKPISRKLRLMLKDMGVQIPVEYIMQGKDTKEVSYDPELYVEPEHKEVELPDNAFRIDLDDDYFWQNYIRDRGITTGTYFLSEGKLIIPFYYRGKMIGYKKFSSNGFRESHGSDLLYMPLGYVPMRPVVVEGEYDALSMPNAVAVGQSTVSAKQAWYLRDKQPVLLPDRKGSRFIDVAKKYGWDIIVPDYKSWQVKDLNEAILQFGSFVTARMLYENKFSADNLFAAEVRYNMWRE